MVVSWLLLNVQVHGQGTRCQTRADCTGKKNLMSVAVRDTIRITRNDNSQGYTNFC